MWKFIIDREIEAPDRFQAIQTYRCAVDSPKTRLGSYPVYDDFRTRLPSGANPCCETGIRAFKDGAPSLTSRSCDIANPEP